MALLVFDSVFHQKKARKIGQNEVKIHRKSCLKNYIKFCCFFDENLMDFELENRVQIADAAMAQGLPEPFGVDFASGALLDESWTSFWTLFSPF